MPVNSRYTRILIGSNGAGGAWDFASVSNNLEVSVNADRLEDTTFQATAATFVTGDPKGSIKQQGYYTNTGAGTLETELADAIEGSEALYVTALFGTNATQPIAYIAQQTNTDNMAIAAPVANLITLNGSWPQGTGMLRGVQLYTGTIAATGAQTYIDLGAAGSAGGKAWLYVTAISGTATNATCTIQSDDEVTFAGAATEGTFTFSAGGCYPITLSGAIDRYVRLNCTSKGGSTSFTVFAIVAVAGIHYAKA